MKDILQTFTSFLALHNSTYPLHPAKLNQWRVCPRGGSHQWRGIPLDGLAFTDGIHVVSAFPEGGVLTTHFNNWTFPKPRSNGSKQKPKPKTIVKAAKPSTKVKMIKLLDSL